MRLAKLIPCDIQRVHAKRLERGDHVLREVVASAHVMVLRLDRHVHERVSLVWRVAVDELRYEPRLDGTVHVTEHTCERRRTRWRRSAVAADGRKRLESVANLVPCPVLRAPRLRGAPVRSGMRNAKSFSRCSPMAARSAMNLGERQRRVR